MTPNRIPPVRLVRPFRKRRLGGLVIVFILAGVTVSRSGRLATVEAQVLPPSVDPAIMYPNNVSDRVEWQESEQHISP